MKLDGRLYSAGILAVIVISLGVYYLSKNGENSERELANSEKISSQTTVQVEKVPEKIVEIVEHDIDNKDSKPLLENVYFATIETAIDTRPDKLVDVYDELVRKAQDGDVAAARQLALELWDCNYAHSDRASLNEALDRIEKEKIVAFPDPETDGEWEVDVSADGGDVISEHISDLTSSYNRCNGIDASKKALPEVEKWAKLAAEKGDYQAIKHLQMRARKNPPEAVKWLNEAWDKLGDVDALRDIAIYHSRGVGEGQAPNFEKAYAYNRAYTLIKSASRDQFESEFSNKTVNEFFNSVDNRSAIYGSQLGANETAAAEALAREIIEGNENCCSSLRWW